MLFKLQRLMVGCTILIIGLTSPVFANDNFTSSGTVTTAGVIEEASLGFTNIESAIDFFANASLLKVFPGYIDPLSTLDGQLNYRGLPMSLGYLTSGSTEMTFTISSLQINESFSGNSRDDSKDLFDDFLKENGSDILGRIHKELARVSPTDPVAGNPTSLMGRAVETSFQSGFFNLASSGYYQSSVKLNLDSLSQYNYNRPASSNFRPSSSSPLQTDSQSVTDRQPHSETQPSTDAPSSANLPRSDMALDSSSGNTENTASTNTSNANTGTRVADGQQPTHRLNQADITSTRGDHALQEGTESLALQREQSASTTIFEGAPDSRSKGNQVGVGVDVERYDISGNDVDVYRLPISYTLRSEDDPRKTLLINVPLTYANTNDADTYTINADVSVSWPINRIWTLTPTVGYGITGSEDLGSVGQLMSFALTSHLQFQLADRSEIHIGNMIGQYNTLPSHIGDYDIDPDIANTAFRNGLMYRTAKGKLFSHSTTEVFLIDTRFTGDDLFADEYQEVGIAFSLPGDEEALPEEELKLGITYLHSSADVKAVKANFGYKF